MQQSTSRERIIQIIQKILTDVDISSIDFNAPIREVVNIDSIQLIAVMSRLEDELKIELPISTMEVETLEEFFTIVESSLS